MVDGITNSSATAYSSTANNSAALGKEQFLELLIAQLKYQDPLSPMEGAEFSSQLAQFSSLEQLTNINETLETSVNSNYYLTQSINNTMIANFVGKDVKVSSNMMSYDGQESAEFGYNLPSQASSVKINIYNESGRLVKTLEDLPLLAGEHKLSWDFTDNKGDKVSNGNYRIEFEAISSDSNGTLYPQAFVYGTIDSVRFTENGTVLLVGDNEYQLSEILEILKGEG